MTESAGKTSPVIIAVMWIIVTVPLGWGVFESVKKSLPLFQAAAAPEAPAVK
jgi:hypothetical protein